MCRSLDSLPRWVSLVRRGALIPVSQSISHDYIQNSIHALRQHSCSKGDCLPFPPHHFLARPAFSLIQTLPSTTPFDTTQSRIVKAAAIILQYERSSMERATMVVKVGQ